MLASVCIPPLATRVLPAVALCAIVGLNTVGETHFGLTLNLSASKRLSGVDPGPKAAPETHFELISSLQRVEVALWCGFRAKRRTRTLLRETNRVGKQNNIDGLNTVEIGRAHV